MYPIQRASLLKNLFFKAPFFKHGQGARVRHAVALLDLINPLGSFLTRWLKAVLPGVGSSFNNIFTVDHQQSLFYYS
jgi:hypothetical protein